MMIDDDDFFYHIFHHIFDSIFDSIFEQAVEDADRAMASLLAEEEAESRKAAQPSKKKKKKKNEPKSGEEAECAGTERIEARQEERGDFQGFFQGLSLSADSEGDQAGAKSPKLGTGEVQARLPGGTWEVTHTPEDEGQGEVKRLSGRKGRKQKVSASHHHTQPQCLVPSYTASVRNCPDCSAASAFMLK
jgi:hypothetical protein